jgi:hypothetical protein
MKQAIYILMMLLVISSPLYARLGETEAQIKTRYGLPLTEENYTTNLVKDSKARVNTYRVDKLRIKVMFLGGVSQCEVYEGIETEQGIKTILDANAGQYHWEETTIAADRSGEFSAFINRSYKLGNLVKTVATASYFYRILTIATPDGGYVMDEIDKVKKKEAEKPKEENLKGF